MIKSFLSKVLLKIEANIPNPIKESIFRNVFLYPSVLFILLLPILVFKHPFYMSVLGGLALTSLIGYFMCLKRRLICQVEYPLMLLLLALGTLLSYIGFFIHDEVYSYMFIFSIFLGSFTTMNIFMMFTGNTKTVLNHYIEPKFLEGYSSSDLLILDQLMMEERIIVRYIFCNFKDLYKGYFIKSNLYISIDFSVFENGESHYCRVADNFELKNSYSLLSVIQHMQDENIKAKTFSRADFEVFEMKHY